MRKIPNQVSNATIRVGNLNLPKKQKRFRDPRLRWMDELLRSLKRPAPDAWLPPQYRPFFEEAKRQDRRKH